ELPKQMHERGHLWGRPGPVLFTEGVQREGLHPEPARGSHDLAHCLAPASMSVGAGFGKVLGPPAVPVHDDGHMAGKTPQIDERHGRGAYHGGVGAARWPEAAHAERRTQTRHTWRLVLGIVPHQALSADLGRSGDRLFL